MDLNKPIFGVWQLDKYIFSVKLGIQKLIWNIKSLNFIFLASRKFNKRLYKQIKKTLILVAVLLLY